MSTGSESPPTASKLFLLVGPPAVGKLSVARELERRIGAIVVDNHLVNNAVFVPMGMNRGAGVELARTDALRDRVWDIVFDATEAAPAAFSHVFTVWLSDKKEDAAYLERLQALAERRAAHFVPVWLSASSDALRARVDAPGRAERHKLTDPEILSALLEMPELPAPAETLHVDLTTEGPEDAVTRILDAIGPGAPAESL